jgi:signal transduction histidine kinase
LLFAGGLGAILYLIGLALTIDSVSEAPEIEPDPRPEQKLALAMMFVGLLLALRTAGAWFGDDLVVPVLLVSFGLAVIWDQSDPGRRDRWAALVLPAAGHGTSPTVGRALVGGVLLLAGVAIFFGSVDVFADMRNVTLAALITGIGFMLVFGPWVWRLAADLGSERSERIRADERAEVAAHLHDSVLQSLALIQRTQDPRKMVTLARSQERELRSWLYDRAPTPGADLLSTAIRVLADKVERDHDVPVEVVTAGDVALSEPIDALVKAAGEAMANAARHSGAPRVSVYVEVSDTDVEVWVSDQGTGFDPESVPPDRRGIADSVKGRMRRHGGEATITSDPEDGTEVWLHVGRNGR